MNNFNTKKKISITTYFYSNNFGAILQAMSLKEFILKRFNTDVHFTKFQPKSFLFHEILKPMMRKRPSIIYEVLKKNIKLYFWRSKNNIPFPDLFLKKNYHNINIFGSDEIWNFKNHYNGYENFFFGKFSNAKKISYAVSIGNAKLENIEKKYFLEINELLEKFSFISVRDSSTCEFVKKITGKSPPIVLDPCLLENKNFMDETSLLPEKNKYVVVYGNFFSDENKKKIIEFCNNNKLKIYSLSYFNSWTDNKVSIHGDEFINYFKNAEMVFTSTFHGIIFSYKFKKNFWFEKDPRKTSKSEFFLNKLNLTKRYIKYAENFEEKVDYGVSEKIFKEWQKFSQDYLENAINNSIKN